jgi:hypothetical protein
VAAAERKAWMLAYRLYQDLQLGFVLDPSPDPVLMVRTPQTVRSLLDSDEFVVECFLRAEGADMQLGRFRAGEWAPDRRRGSFMIAGSPSLIAGYVAGSLVRDTVDRHRAKRAVEPRWRPDGSADVVVTNKRLWYQLVGGQWHWLRYDTVTVMDPEVQNLAFTLSFDGASTHRFTGEWAPWCAVVVAYFIGRLPHWPSTIRAGLAALTSSPWSVAG